MNEHPTNEHEVILEKIRPRMRSARIAHLRRLMAGVLLVPMLGVGAAAMAADGGDEPVTETASASDSGESVSDFVAPEIGTASGDEMVVGDEADEPDEPEVEAADDGPIEVDLGVLGKAEVAPAGRSFELLDTELEAGWSVELVETDGDVLTVVLKRGDVIKVVKIRPGVRDEVSVEIVDLVIPQPPEPEPSPEPEPVPPPVVEPPVEEPEPEPEQPATGRWVVEVEGKGSFVVEREGETLYLGNIETAAGYDHVVMSEQGWKVHVMFTNGEHDWHGKAFIDDNGEVQQHFWDESRIPEPVYQWVEIDGVGAARFKLYDNRIWVKEMVPGPGFGAWDYNQGEPGETAKVDFEGEGTVWFIDVWISESGEMVWATSQGGGDPIL